MAEAPGVRYRLNQDGIFCLVDSDGRAQSSASSTTPLPPELFNYETLYNYLQFDVGGKIQTMQASINAIPDLEQRKKLAQIRDRKVNQEYQAMNGKYIGDSSAQNDCQRNIDNLKKLTFTLEGENNLPHQEGVLFQDDGGISASQVIVTKSGKWIPL